MRSSIVRFSCAAAIAASLALLAPHPAAMAAPKDDKAVALELQGLDLYEHADYDSAVAKFREAFALTPNDKTLRKNFAEALNAVGTAAYGKKNYAAAIDNFQEALKLAPSFGLAKANLVVAQVSKLNDEGMAMFKAADFDGAVGKFKQVLVVDPGNKIALVNRDTAEARILTKSGDLAGAVAKLQEAVSAAPTNTFLQGQLSEAQAALAAATPPPKDDKSKPAQ